MSFAVCRQVHSCVIPIALCLYHLPSSFALAAAHDTPSEVVRETLNAATISAREEQIATRFFSTGFRRDMEAFFRHADCGPWSGNIVVGDQGVERLNIASLTEISRTGTTALVSAMISTTATEDEGGTTGKPFGMIFVLLNEGGPWKVDEIADSRSRDPNGSSPTESRLAKTRHTFFRAMIQSRCRADKWPE